MSMPTRREFAPEDDRWTRSGCLIDFHMTRVRPDVPRPRDARPLARLGLLLGALVVASACATPIGVDRVDHTVVYRSLSHSVLSSREPSLYSQQLLSRRGLTERFDDDPEAVLAELRGSGSGIAPDTLFVL